MNHEEEFNVEGYEHAFTNEPLFQDLEYQEGSSAAQGQAHATDYEEEYEEEGEDGENYAEPAQGAKKPPDKKRTMILAGVLALVLAGGAAYMFAPDQIADLPNSIMGMLTGGGSEEQAAEPAPEPAVAKPHHKHPGAAAVAAGAAAIKHHIAKHAPKPPADDAGQPAQQAAAPADDSQSAPKPDSAEFKPAHKPVAKAVKHAAAVAAVAKHVAAKHAPKPKVAAKPKPAAAVAARATGPSTQLAFAPGSYWLAAAEIERLWSYTTHLKANSGQFTVESWVGSEPDALNLSRKRANRVAELLEKNTPAHAYKVTVKVHGAPGSKLAARKVNVSFSSKL